MALWLSLLAAAVGALAAGAPVSNVSVLDEEVMRELDAVSDDDVMGELAEVLQEMLPSLTSQLKDALPASYGACSYDIRRRRRRAGSRRRRWGAGATAPSPCEGGENQYLWGPEHKPWLYKAVARWVSGINTLQLTSAEPSPATGGFSLAISGLFERLPVSIKIAQCLSFDQCSTLWDNDSACCGSNKHFTVNIHAQCGSSGSAPLAGLSLTSISLDSLQITEKIMGEIKFPVTHITVPVKRQVESTLKEYMTSKPFIEYQGSKVTLVDYLNSEKYISTVLPSVCSRLPALTV